MTDTYQALIDSDRVSPQTRTILEARGQYDDRHYQPSLFNSEQLQTVRALADRIVPQKAEGVSRIDFAARLDRQLASGEGDGWRYASLPKDGSAYIAGLALLDEMAKKLSGTPFHRLTSEAQDALINGCAAGRMSSAQFDLKKWFEDLRADLTKLYVSHPATLARMNYSGIADDPNGFVQLGVGKLDAWEPRTK